MPEDPPYKVPFTCFGCLKTFKRPYDKETTERICPHCGGKAVRMDIRFRPPKRSDDKAWKKVIFLAQHGFYFQKIYRMTSPGAYQRVRYPSSLGEAKKFVKVFKDQSIDRGI